MHALDLVVRAAALARDDARATCGALDELRPLARKVNTRIALGALAEAEASDARGAAGCQDRPSRGSDRPVPARRRLLRIGCGQDSARRRWLDDAGQPERARREREIAKAVATRIAAAGLVRRASVERSVSGADDLVSHSGTSLSARELEVLGLIAQGLSNQDIGDCLFVSPFTIKRHVANILAKLDLPSRAAAASYAVRNHLT